MRYSGVFVSRGMAGEQNYLMLPGILKLTDLDELRKMVKITSVTFAKEPAED